MVPRPTRMRDHVETTAPTARARFLATDAYRAEREWLRYEGTAQRDLFRDLRERFLERHRASRGWVADLGAGPARFTDVLGAGSARAVAVDLSVPMLRKGQEARLGRAGEALRAVRGDAGRPPLQPGRFDTVALLGNLLGFAGEDADRILSASIGLLEPGGRLLIEVAPGAGERSNYLGRLPPGAVARLLRAPPAAIAPRVEREGFSPVPARKPGGSGFLRIRISALTASLATAGLSLREVISVAPALGSDAVRLTAARADNRAWGRLLELEERLGRDPSRMRRAAAVLLAAERSGDPNDSNLPQV